MVECSECRLERDNITTYKKRQVCKDCYEKIITRRNLLIIICSLLLVFILFGSFSLKPEFDHSYFYGYLLILLGLLLAFYWQLMGISKPQSLGHKDGVSGYKLNLFAWLSFFTLTLMGTIIFLIGTFSNIIYYRIFYYYQENIVNINELSHGLVNNNSTLIVDSGFILFCFITLFVSILRVGMGTTKSYSGKFTFSPSKMIELVVIAVNVNHIWLLLFIIACLFIGISFMLIAMYIFILVPLFNYIVKYGVPY